MCLTSHDLLADRRFAWATALADGGDHVAAADLFEQVVERVPAWAPGWAALAEARERGGDGDAARAAWSRVAAIDPEHGLGAAAHLARLEGQTPEALPEGYVRALFDDYASRFDQHLVGMLDYRGPDVLLAALDRTAPGRRFALALDLGCGTGLMGRALTDRAALIHGVDLSPAMVEQARRTGVYATLQAGTLASALAASPPDAYGLVVAADVLVYVGDLAAVFTGAARVLAPGGLLAFTVQTLASDDGVTLGPDMRFAHAPGYIERMLGAAGLVSMLLEPASTRREKGAAVPGLVVVAAVR